MLNNKKILTLLFVASLLVLCKKEQATEVLSKPCIIPDIEKLLIDNSNQLGFDCFRQLSMANEIDENILVSPLAISLSLSSLLQASDNRTNSEIKHCLRIDNVKDSLIIGGFDHLNNLYSKIDYNSQIKCSSKIAISTGVNLEPEFENFIKVSNYTDIIYDQNAGFIDDIQNKSSVQNKNSFQLINSVDFTSRSKYQIRSEESPFYKSPNESSFTEMIVSKSELNYYSDQTVRAIEIPLGRGNFNILLLIPQNSESIEDLCKKMDKKLLERIKKKFRAQYLEVIMPKISLTGIKTLKGIFKNNKILSSFEEKTADFSKISKQNNLFLSDFEHIINLNISSNGMEKSDVAADSNENGPSVLVDHPFIFIIYEKYSAGILLIGKIATI
jgi:serine protease inhibitor